MGEVQNEEWLEVTLPTGQKVIINKVITLDLVIDNVIFTQQCFFLPITNPIILGSDFLDAHFAALDIGDSTITLCIGLITCLPPASPMILYMISTLRKNSCTGHNGNIVQVISKRKCRKVH